MKKAYLLVLLLILAAAFCGCEMFSSGDTSSQGTTESSVSLAESVSEILVSWPGENELATSVPEFSAGKISSVRQEENILYITINEVSGTELEMYISALKSNGFTDIIYETDALFSAYKRVSEVELLGITLSLTGDPGTLLIDLSKASPFIEDESDDASDMSDDDAPITDESY